MSLPRGIEERIDWFLSHNPSGSGMCAQHTWHSLGGNEGNPPAWGTPNANAVYDKVIASGRYWTSTPIPKGAAIYWKYGNNGHAALSYGDGKIVTTDPSGSAMTGVESLSFPEGAFGASASKRIYTDQYNGVRFDIGDGISHGDVYLSKLVKGQQDSDSVKRLQLHLNDHVLADGSTLPVTGNFGDQTMHEIDLDREQHWFPDTGLQVSEAQCKHLIQFGDCGCKLHADIEEETVPPEPEPTPPPTDGETLDLGIEYSYSGKPAGELKFSGSYKKLDVPPWAPKKDGLNLAMLYANVDGEGEIRVRLIRDPDDATAYQTFYVRGGDNCLITHVWFESGEAGRKLWWEFCSMDGTSHTVTTRYAKFVCIPWEVAASAARMAEVEATVKSWVTGG